MANFDWRLYGLVLLIVLLGIVNIYSASASYTLTGSPYYLKQLYWLLTGSLLVVLVSRVGYRRLRVEHYELDDRDARDARRPELVAELAQRFVDVLASFLDRHPALWFNFYDFWQAPERGVPPAPTEWAIRVITQR